MIGMDRDRRAIKPEDLTDEELEWIAAAEVPPEYAHLDEEVGEWGK